jgi:hypothetical protein
MPKNTKSARKRGRDRLAEQVKELAQSPVRSTKEEKLLAGLETFVRVKGLEVFHDQVPARQLSGKWVRGQIKKIRTQDRRVGSPSVALDELAIVEHR